MDVLSEIYLEFNFFNETPNELFLKGDELQANQEKNLSINFIQFYYF